MDFNPKLLINDEHSVNIVTNDYNLIVLSIYAMTKEKVIIDNNNKGKT